MEEVRTDLNSTNIGDCLFAIREYALHGERDDICIAALKRLKTDDGCWYIRVADAACAALDLSGAEPYTGESDLVKELIKTRFYTIG